MRSERKRWLTIGAFAVVYLVWGSTYFAIGLGIRSIPPMLMAGSRFLAAGCILSLWGLARGAAAPTAAQWARAGVAGFLMLVLGNGCVTWAVQYVPSSMAALLVASEPMWLVLAAWACFGGSRPGLRTSLGLATGLLGVGLLVAPQGGGFNAGVLAGSLAILLAAVAWAVGSLFLRTADLPSSPSLATGMQMLTGGAALTTLGLLRGEAAALDPAAISTTSALAWVYLIVFGSMLGFSAYGYLITATSPARLSTYAYVNPVVAVLLGGLVGRETIPPTAWLAMLIILASVVLVTAEEGEPSAEAEIAEAAILAPEALGDQA